MRKGFPEAAALKVMDNPMPTSSAKFVDVPPSSKIQVRH
jgi:hypothetical protein